YLCRRGTNQLWRRNSAGIWSDVTAETKVSGGNENTVDGACFDADHDGDLDYLLANSAGKNQLLSNNRNGSFRSIAEDLGLSVSATSTKQVLITDIDSDDDADILFINQQKPHEVWVNDRFWNYRVSPAFEKLTTSECLAATACDTNVDGQVEIFTLDSSGVSQWQPNTAGQWVGKRVVSRDFSAETDSDCSIALVDVDGDTDREILTVCAGDWRVDALDGTEITSSETSNAGLATAAIWQQTQGPAIIGFRPSDVPYVWNPGTARHAFVLFTLSGKTDKAAEMRSNASGIGVLGTARIQGRWATVSPFRASSGPGQSLQPTTIGLAGSEQVDFLRLLWPDGVSQTELNIKPGKRVDIAETQRQAGSCPLVFVWDGQRFAFVADVLGAGGIGFNLGRSDYYEPRSKENLHLPAGLLQPKDGKYLIKLGEPMEEICYFDAVRLVAYDIPSDWQMTLDERFGAAEPLPTGRPLFYRKQLVLTRATNDRDQNITTTVSSVDKVAAPLDRRDHRFIGLADPRSITLEFDRPIDSLQSPVLVFDGWVEYAYSQTAFAAWQANEQYFEPTIEARGEDGKWQVVCERFGYMAGTPRQSSMPLDTDRLPRGARELRISTNMQIYWDRLAIVDAGSVPEFKRQELALVTALVDDVGFSTRKLHDQRYTTYNYDDRPPMADARHPAGFYTRLGDARKLVEATDDALAIIGPGEALHLEFNPPAKDPPAGWTRHFVLESDGWCKDADLFTKDAGTVEPLPMRGDPADEQAIRHRKKLHAKYNTRFKSGY
ncbi:MAG: FG-GAP-like repeat-containing protein, partial [Bythopirellula sp.]